MKIYKIILVIGIVNLTSSYNMLRQLFRLSPKNIVKNHSTIKNAFRYSTNQFIPIEPKPLLSSSSKEVQKEYLNEIYKYNNQIKNLENYSTHLNEIQYTLNNNNYTSTEEKNDLKSRLFYTSSYINKIEENLNKHKRQIENIEEHENILINQPITQSELSKDINLFNNMLKRIQEEYDGYTYGRELSESVIKQINELKENSPHYHTIPFLQALRSDYERNHQLNMPIDKAFVDQILAWADWFELNPDKLPTKEHILVNAAIRNKQRTANQEKISKELSEAAKARSGKLFEAVSTLKEFLTSYTDYYYQNSTSIKINNKILKKIYNLIAINEKEILKEKLTAAELFLLENYSHIIWFLESLANIKNALLYEYNVRENKNLRAQIEAFATFFKENKNNDKLPTYEYIKQNIKFFKQQENTL
jgi:hypothetical protein